MKKSQARVRNHRIYAGRTSTEEREREREKRFSLHRRKPSWGTARVRSPAAASGCPPTGSCNISEQCHPGQREREREEERVRQSPAPGNRAIIHHSRAFLRCAWRALTLAPVPRGAPSILPRHRTHPYGRTDLSHFPSLRDADVMKRASPRACSVSKTSFRRSQKIPRTFADKSS